MSYYYFPATGEKNAKTEAQIKHHTRYYPKELNDAIVIYLSKKYETNTKIPDGLNTDIVCTFREGATYNLQEIIDPKAHLLLKIDNNKIVGLIQILGKKDTESNNKSNITIDLVCSNVKGLGKELIDIIKKLVTELKISQITLTLDNISLTSYYTGQGFTTSSEDETFMIWTPPKQNAGMRRKTANKRKRHIKKNKKYTYKT